MVRMPVSEVVFRQDLYPRLTHDPALVQKYQDNLEVLPPIEVNQNNILIDGWHRWAAHRQAGYTTIEAMVVETESEAEVLRLSVLRNAAHGKQMSYKDKRAFARKMYAAKEMTADDLQRLLSVSKRWMEGALKDLRKAEKEEQARQIRNLWTLAYSNVEIATKLGIDEGTVRNTDLAPTPAAFEKPPLYDVWTANKSTNAVAHPGQTAQDKIEKLLYLYTDPGDIVIDPFAGGGSTIDVCRKYGRRCLASDLTPIASRESEIRQHDIMTGLLKPPLWKDVSLVYLDPPYGAQVKGKYSDKEEDLANIDHDELTEKLYEIIAAYFQKLPDGAHIALIIQAPQWFSENKRRHDHVWRLAEFGLKPPVERIQCPYSPYQAQPQMVNWAKENRRILTISREIVVWEVDNG